MAAETENEKGRVCVTGGGFLASWVIKILLSKNYFVHATVRQPGDVKYAHLNEFENASTNLKLFKADLLDYESICSAVEGCIGVFHVASPVPSTNVSNPEVEVIEPDVKGTLNVLKACVEAKVKRVVVVSSVYALMLNSSWPKDQVMDETCWSDMEYCRTTKNWYGLSKTEAESEALEFAKRSGLDVVTVCPSLILGPILQRTVNASSLVILSLLTDGCESLENKIRYIVDIRDVAEALLLAYENPGAEGRYICMAYAIEAKDVVDLLKNGCESLENKLRYIVDVRDVAEALLLAYENPGAEGRYVCMAYAIEAKDVVDLLKSIYPNYNIQRTIPKCQKKES